MLRELSAKLPLYLYHMTHPKNWTSLSYRLNPSPAPRYYNHIYLYFTMFIVYIILFILNIDSVSLLLFYILTIKINNGFNFLRIFTACLRHIWTTTASTAT